MRRRCLVMRCAMLPVLLFATSLSAQTGITRSKNPDTANAQLKPATVKALTEDELAKLLSSRVDGGGGGLTFRQFSNLYLVASNIKLGYGVGLMTESKEIADHTLLPTHPDCYRPTVREFLDAIALQTASEWAYDPSGKFVQSDDGKPVEGLAIFEFKPTQRKKPYEINLPVGWTAQDHGNWVMHVPPTFPLGMDVYDLGLFSAKQGEDRTKFVEQLRRDIALEWAKRVNEKARTEDLKPASVGAYDAVYYEAMIPSQLGRETRWRHWVFFVGDRGYFVVSTIFPEMEAALYPDVHAMLKSFKKAAD